MSRIAVCGMLLLSGCNGETQDQPADGNPVRVEVTEVERQTIEESIIRIGTIHAGKIVEVSPEAAGIVEDVHFEEGQSVDVNDPLFTLDAAKLRSQLTSQKSALEAAKADLQLAKAMYDRFQDLYKEGAATAVERDRRQTEYERAVAEVERLRGQVDLLEERISDTRVRAPIEGTVSESLVDEGDFVTAGQPLTTIYSPDLEARFSVPEDYAPRVHVGQRTETRVPAYPGRTFEGAVTFIGPNVDERTRTLLIKSRVEDPNGLLRSGQFARVRLILATYEDEPVVPEEALVAAEGGYFVFVVRDGSARRQEVTVGVREAGRAQITSGLESGQTIITAGQMRLTDGAKIETGDREADGGNAEPNEPAEEQADAPGETRQ